MAQIKAFKAMKFDESKVGNLKDVVCPPYDIIDEKGAQRYLNASKYNIIRLEKPVGENAYRNAQRLLNEWKSSGVLKDDESDCIYIYEEEFSALGETRAFKGIICLVKLEEFSKGVILPHEETLSKAKQDRLNLMKSTFCNFSQIYSIYIDKEHSTLNIIDKLSSGAPDVEVCDDNNVLHRVWKIKDKDIISKIICQFKDRKLFIADGHHRYETAINFRDYCKDNGKLGTNGNEDYVMMLLVDMEQDGLVVFPTHRLLRDIENFDSNKILNECREFFEIERKDNPDLISEELKKLYDKGKKAFAFYNGEDIWYLLKLKQECDLKKILADEDECKRELDVTILHKLILERCFNIDKENMANQKNLNYTRNFNEAIDKINNGEFQCGFIMNPTRISEIKDVAESGEKMPQKSTYFYPKPITGLIMNKIKD